MQRAKRQLVGMGIVGLIGLSGCTSGAVPGSTGTASPSPGTSASPPDTGPTPVPTPPPSDRFAAVHGRITDETGRPLAGVTVTARVLGVGSFANTLETQATTTTGSASGEANNGGAYLIGGAPIGSTIQLTATKAGWTSRTRTTVISMNVKADDAINRLDFGQADTAFALSDQPEVVSVRTVNTVSGVEPGTSFAIRFSEPVNATDIQDGLAVYAATVTGAESVTLSAGVTLPTGYDAISGTLTRPQAPIYDLQAFTSVWSDNGQALMLTFKPGYQLPSDKVTAPVYALAFRKPFRDQAGTSRSSQIFRTETAKVATNGYSFPVALDTARPRVLSIRAVEGGSAPTSGTSTRDRLRVQFSEPMVLFPLSLADGTAAIPAATAAISVQNALNFRYAVSVSQPGAIALSANSAIGARLVASDPTNATVEFAPSSDDEMNAGSTVWLRALPFIADPAGNLLDAPTDGYSGSTIMN